MSGSEPFKIGLIVIVSILKAEFEVEVDFGISILLRVGDFIAEHLDKWFFKCVVPFLLDPEKCLWQCVHKARHSPSTSTLLKSFQTLDTNLLRLDDSPLCIAEHLDKWFFKCVVPLLLDPEKCLKQWLQMARCLPLTSTLLKSFQTSDTNLLRLEEVGSAKFTAFCILEGEGAEVSGHCILFASYQHLQNNTTDGETNLNYFKLKRWKFEMSKTFSCHNNEGQAKERETDG